MKVLIVLLIVGATQAGTLVYKHPLLHPGLSSQYKVQDKVGNYAFGYFNGKPEVASSHYESGTAGGAKVGSYKITSPDGKVRVVDYVADQGGFRADVKSNEKGVESKNPADVSINEAKVAYYPYYYPHYPQYPYGGGVAYY